MLCIQLVKLYRFAIIYLDWSVKRHLPNKLVLYLYLENLTQKDFELNKWIFLLLVTVLLVIN